MRPIKFRAWQKTHKYYTYSLMMNMSGGIFYHGNPNDGIPYDDTFVVEQFTGLLDKDGKTIYEGDIVKIGLVKQPQLVGYDESKGCFCFVYDTGEPMRKFNPREISRFTVIGNVHENSELLK